MNNLSVNGVGNLLCLFGLISIGCVEEAQKPLTSQDSAASVPEEVLASFEVTGTVVDGDDAAELSSREGEQRSPTTTAPAGIVANDGVSSSTVPAAAAAAAAAALVPSGHRRRRSLVGAGL